MPRRGDGMVEEAIKKGGPKKDPGGGGGGGDGFGPVGVQPMTTVPFFFGSQRTGFEDASFI